MPLLSLLALLVGPALAGTPMAGLEWRPIARSDLVWVADDRATGTAVGEGDGVVRPNLQAFAGAWVSERVGLTGTLGLARLTATTFQGETWINRHRGVIRPGVDLRVSLLRRSDDRPRPLVLVGLYGDIPSARIASEGFDAEEEEQADLDAAVDRARLGGVGARVGLGADLRVHEHVAVGFLWSTRLHRAVLRTSEASTVTAWLSSEAALTVAFEWPRRRSVPEAPGAASDPAPSGEAGVEGP